MFGVSASGSMGVISETDTAFFFGNFNAYFELTTNVRSLYIHKENLKERFTVYTLSCNAHFFLMIRECKADLEEQTLKMKIRYLDIEWTRCYLSE